MTEAYPLFWPQHKKRLSNNVYRDSSRFKTTFAVARDELFHELRMLPAKNIVLSTNIPLRNDGLPYANFRQPEDPGVAVYFQYKGKSMCFACDRWKKIEDNIQAVRHTIGALRGIARWGSGDMLEAAFTGFQALEAPRGSSARPWWIVLGVPMSSALHVAEAAYKAQAMENHPDVGGSTDKMAELNAAIKQAREDEGIK